MLNIVETVVGGVATASAPQLCSTTNNSKTIHNDLKTQTITSGSLQQAAEQPVGQLVELALQPIDVGKLVAVTCRS